MKSSERRTGRVIAMQALYGVDAAGQDPTAAIEALATEHEASPATSAFAMTLVQGVLQHQDAVDAIVGEAAPQFPLEQLAGVDKAILRVAVFELRFARGVPPKVAINEAIEIAKEYGGESSGRFVNGALGHVVQALGREEG